MSLKRCMSCGHPVFEIKVEEEKTCFHYIPQVSRGLFLAIGEIMFGGEEPQNLSPRSKLCPYSGCKCNKPIIGLVVEEI